jgi:sporulation protein YlmC with PRC-barrel domain
MMDVIRDVLDNQVVDRNQHKMGKVDGIIVELREGQPPRLAYLEIGVATLAHRFHPRLASWVMAIESKWGAKKSKPFRIPWSKVLDVGIDVDVDVEAEQTPALAYELWLREHVIKRIPGGN